MTLRTQTRRPRVADAHAAAQRRWRVRFRVTPEQHRAADGLTVVATRTILLPEGWSVLTRRERQIALMLCSGLRRSDVHMRLGISLKTIDSHRTSIMWKLKLRNEVELLLSVLEWPTSGDDSEPGVEGPSVIVRRDDGEPIIDEEAWRSPTRARRG